MSAKKYTDNQIHWLKNLSENEFRAVREAVDKVASTSQKAIDEVKSTNIAKFESVNEFRNQLKDQAATFVTRRELWIGFIAAVGIAISIMQLMK